MLLKLGCTTQLIDADGKLHTGEHVIDIEPPAGAQSVEVRSDGWLLRWFMRIGDYTYYTEQSLQIRKGQWSCSRASCWNHYHRDGDFGKPIEDVTVQIQPEQPESFPVPPAGYEMFNPADSETWPPFYLYWGLSGDWKVGTFAGFSTQTHPPHTALYCKRVDHSGGDH